MKIHIKNMVSNRCIMVVKEELKKLGLHYIMVDLGEVEIMENISGEQREKLNKNLLKSGFELLEDHRAILVEKIKKEIIAMVYYSGEKNKLKFSSYLSDKLNHNYNYLAGLFSEVKGTSIQQYIILCKIEHIKELLIYDELSVSEIAWKMNYSGVAHLSNQFKKITGLSPFHFKQIKDKRRCPIEEITSGEANDGMAFVSESKHKQKEMKDYSINLARALSQQYLCIAD